MNLDDAKVTLIEYCLHSIESGGLDEDVQMELASCYAVAKTIRNLFLKALLLDEINYMVKERIATK